MDSKYFIKIIKEEVKNFDFLGNDEALKEQEVNELLIDENLQKQFICDSLLGRDDKVKILKIVDSFITGNWDEANTDDANRLGIEYSLDMGYVNEIGTEPIKFVLTFSSDNIDISVGGESNSGDYFNQPTADSWYDSFDWNDINVDLYTMDGEEIRFTAFENAPPNIQALFIREFTQNFIENETMQVKTKEMRDNIQNTPYC